MNPDILEKIQSNAKAIARRYKRRCWWVPLDDVEQEAIHAQLSAYQRYDPTRGPDLGAYLWYVALYAARRLVHKLSAPVSHSHRVEKLRHLTRVPILASEIDTDEAVRPELTDSDTPESAAHRARLAAKVRERTVELLGADGAHFALSVISGEFRAKDVVEEHGGLESEVYEATAHVKAILIRDTELFELWREAT